jgi:hypothetical protein
MAADAKNAQKSRFTRQNMPGLRAALQLAGSLEKSVGRYCLLLSQM